MRLSFKILTLCLVVFFVSPIVGVVAEDGPEGTWKAPPIGTKAVYNYGASWKVTAVEGGKVHVKGARSSEVQDVKWYIYRGIVDSINFRGNRMSFDTDVVDNLFPLKVGKSITVETSSADGNLKITYKVIALKNVKTILGKRHLFKISFAERGVNHRAKGWGFYDPEYGVWIGGDYTFGNNPTYKWRLVSLERPE